MKKAVECRIREDNKYEEVYSFTLDELVQLISDFNTSDPLDEKHMNITESLNKYFNDYTGRTFKTDRDNQAQSYAPRS